jgi:cellobiose phosphorylase
VSTAGASGTATLSDSPASASLTALQLLSIGNYHVMVTNTGAGYSRWKNLALTRWREDATCDNWGAFCYIRGLSSGYYTSMPLLRAALPDNTRGSAPTERPKHRPERDLVFHNGLGEFTPDGREYVIRLTRGHMTEIFDTDEMAGSSWCADRREFLGACGTLQNPAAMAQRQLSGAVGAALDPSAAITVVNDHRVHAVEVRIPPGASASSAAERAA